MPPPTTPPAKMTLDWEAKGDPVLIAMANGASDLVRDIRAKNPPRWLTYWGAPGTGKTYLARQIHAMHRGSHWLDWVDYCRRFQAREETAGRLRTAVDAKLLVIDDIGAEHQTAAVVGQLHGLLHSRLGRWTIITSNLSIEHWQAIDARISSRLIRGANRHLQCDTLDFATR